MMKVVCINNDKAEGFLEIGIEYDISGVCFKRGGSMWYIDLGDGRCKWFDKNMFVSIMEYRNMQLKNEKS